jgi:hypothetical protein
MLKGPRLEKKPSMKGSEKKRKDHALAKRIKNTRHLGRGSKAPSTHGKHVKRIENTNHTPRLHNKDQQHLAHIECTQQGSRTLNMHRMRVMRIDNT